MNITLFSNDMATVKFLQMTVDSSKCLYILNIQLQFRTSESHTQLKRLKLTHKFKFSTILDDIFQSFQIYFRRVLIFQNW